MQRYLPHGIIVILMLLLIWAAFLWDPSAKPPERRDEPVVAAAPMGGDFTLQSYRGPVALGSLRGKVVALFFEAMAGISRKSVASPARRRNQIPTGYLPHESGFSGSGIQRTLAR